MRNKLKIDKFTLFNFLTKNSHLLPKCVSYRLMCFFFSLLSFCGMFNFVLTKKEIRFNKYGQFLFRSHIGKSQSS